MGQVSQHLGHLLGRLRAIRHVETIRGLSTGTFQHEQDHLDGILILDRVRSLSLDVFPRQRRSGRGRGKGGTSGAR